MLWAYQSSWDWTITPSKTIRSLEKDMRQLSFHIGQQTTQDCDPQENKNKAGELYNCSASLPENAFQIMLH